MSRHGLYLHDLPNRENEYIVPLPRVIPLFPCINPLVLAETDVGKACVPGENRQNAAVKTIYLLASSLQQLTPSLEH